MSEEPSERRREPFTPSQAEGVSVLLGAMWLQQYAPRSAGAVRSRSVKVAGLGWLTGRWLQVWAVGILFPGWAADAFGCRVNWLGQGNFGFGFYKWAGDRLRA